MAGNVQNLKPGNEKMGERSVVQGKVFLIPRLAGDVHFVVLTPPRYG